MPDIVNVTGLTLEAKKYQNELRVYPYYLLAQKLTELGINLMQVAGIDVKIESLRKAGLLKPYVAGAINNATELFKFKERELRVRKAYISMKDNVQNYNVKKLLNTPLAGTGINQDKKHPLENLITSGVVKTAGEDILDALFAAEFNPAVQTPLGCFDGFDTLITGYKLSTEISVANKNQYNTGAIVAPVDDTDTTAIKQVVDFIRSQNDFLQKYGVLRLPVKIYRFLVDSLENMKKYQNWDLNAVEMYINQKAQSSVKFIVSNILGTGDRITLTAPDIFDFGMDTFADAEFVQVRSVEDDPNIVQFWLQADFGCRISSLHPKVFCVNDGTPVAASLGGDY